MVWLKAVNGKTHIYIGKSNNYVERLNKWYVSCKLDQFKELLFFSYTTCLSLFFQESLSQNNPWRDTFKHLNNYVGRLNKLDVSCKLSYCEGRLFFLYFCPLLFFWVSCRALVGKTVHYALKNHARWLYSQPILFTPFTSYILLL